MPNLANYRRISNHLAGELDITSALQAVKGEIEKIIEIDHLDICLTDEELHWNTSYEVEVLTSWSSTRSLVTVSPVRDILLGRTDWMMTGDALSDERYVFPGSHCDPIIQQKLRSRINVAMKALGRTVGALNCSSRKRDFYTEADLEQVKILADILAPYFFALRAGEKAKTEAIERSKAQSQQEGLRLGALHLTETLEIERQRIGMDLHDQTLADLTRLARDLKSGMGTAETEALRRRLHACIQDLRGIIDTSIPSILELFGFEEAVAAHFESAAGPNSPIRFCYFDETDGAVDSLPEATRIALFRICQEALNNTLRHAQANKVAVRLEAAHGGNLMLTIRDNGSFQEISESRGGGLTHMRTRAGLIGAEFSLSTKEGTTISVLYRQRLERESA